MFCYVHSHITVLYVGILPLRIEANENESEVFVCVAVFETGVFLNNLRLRIATSDGNAVGI